MSVWYSCRFKTGYVGSLLILVRLPAFRAALVKCVRVESSSASLGERVRGRAWAAFVSISTRPPLELASACEGLEVPNCRRRLGPPTRGCNSIWHAQGLPHCISWHYFFRAWTSFIAGSYVLALCVLHAQSSGPAGLLVDVSCRMQRAAPENNLKSHRGSWLRALHEV